MKQFLLSLWLCLYPIKNICAQQAVYSDGVIIGTVTDSANRPVSGATAILKRQGIEEISLTTISKDNGNFQFLKLSPGTYTLIISHLSYQTYVANQIVISNSTSKFTLPDIRLQNNSSELKEVNIISPQKSYITHQLDRVVINVSSLLSNTGTNALDVLNNAPAVQVTDDAISLRGKDGVTVYIDDRPSYLTGKDLIDYLKTLPSGTLDKIEIMTNPPAKYNAEGNAGIINIKTKKGKFKGFNAGISATFQQGVYSKKNSTINFNYGFHKINLFGNLGYSLANNYYDVKRDRQFHNVQPFTELLMRQFNMETSATISYNYKLGFDYDIDAHNKLGVMTAGIIRPYHEHGNYSTAFNRLNNVDSTINTISRLNYITRNTTVNLNFRHQFDKPTRDLNINTDYLQYSTDPLQVINSGTYLPGNTLISNYTLNTYNPFKAKIFGAKADYADELPGHLKLSIGIQTTYSIRKSTGDYLYTINDKTYPSDSLDGSFSYRENINAAYVSIQKTTKRFDIQLGLRFEHTHAEAIRQSDILLTAATVEYNYNNLFPTAYISYKLDTASANTLILSLGRRISRPGYSDLNSFVFTFDRYSSNKGNPEIVPAYSNSLDLSFNIKDKITAGITYSNTRNDIAQYYQLTGYALTFTPVNISKVTAYGVYFNLSQPVSKWWSANLYSDLTHNQYAGQILNIEYLNNTINTITVSGSQQFKLQYGWSMEINGSYRNNLTYGQGIYLPMWLLNASIQKTILKNKGAITLTARDIFNSRTLRRKIEYQYASLTSSNHSDNQTIGFTFTYKFGTLVSTRQHLNSIETEAGRAGAN
jgi:iron complex outermembrane receptor protein